MKEYKVNVLNELENLTTQFHSVMLRRAAANVNVKHLKTQECLEILESFTKTHPEFKIYQLDDNSNKSLFCSAFISDNESLPYDSESIY